MAKFDLAAALKLPVSKLDTETPVQMLELALLDPHPGNFFTVEEDITDLAESIELNGLLQPLVVAPAGGGRYRTIAGHRRRKALLKLAEKAPEKWRSVSCVVMRPTSPELEELALIQTNTEAREIGWAEKNKAATRVEALLIKLQKDQGIELPGKMRAHVAKLIKASESQIARAKYINDHLASCWKKKNSSISDNVAYKLAHLPTEQQKMLYAHYKDCVRQVSTPAIKAFEENISAGRDPFYVPPEEARKRLRDCSVLPKNGSEYQKCTHSEVIDQHQKDKTLASWQQCRGSCCSFCVCRFDCSDVCPGLAKDLAKHRKTEVWRIGQALRRAREAVGLSVEAAAKHLKKSGQDIVQSETSLRHDVLGLMEYCTLYQTTPNQILGFDSPVPQHTPSAWQPLDDDHVPAGGQLCSIVTQDPDLPIKISGKLFCSVDDARWHNDAFERPMNPDMIIPSRRVLLWCPLPEIPQHLTLALGRLDDSENGGDASE